MRTLDECEVEVVAGGAGSEVIRKGLELCKGLPDSQTVAVAYTVAGSLGGGSTNASTTTTITITTTCGAIRSAPAAKS